MHSSIPRKEHREQEKKGVQPGTTPVPDNKLQHVATEKRQQSSSRGHALKTRMLPAPHQRKQLNTRSTLKLHQREPASAQQQELQATKHTKQLSYQHRKAHSAPQESLQLDACNAPMCLLTEKVTTRWLMPRLGSIQLVH